jgi:AraC-like DNA-binding protein
MKLQGEDNWVLVAGKRNDLPSSLIITRGIKASVMMMDNADQALNLALNNLPDLIVIESFVSESDQIELLSKLNSEPILAHIPIIRYVPNKNEYLYLRGLDSYGDNSFNSTFEVKLLTSQVKEIIKKKVQYREKYRKEYPVLVGSNTSQRLTDHLFQKIIRQIQNKMHKVDFVPNDIVQDFHLTKEQLFRKIYMLTGFTPDELLLNMRLKVAVLLLDCGHDDISRLMSETGFTNRNEFDSSFAEIYGMRPEQYIKR